MSIQPGDRVLDVGSGTGRLAEYVAAIVGPSGSVHVDPLPLRIEIAQRKAKPNLTFAVDDAYALRELADGSFDVIYLNAVFHWFAEKLAVPCRASDQVRVCFSRRSLSRMRDSFADREALLSAHDPLGPRPQSAARRG